MEKGKKFSSVDEYFATLPADTKVILDELRKTITQAAPKAKELISYNMPAIKLHGVLVYYAAYEHHIGFYPTAAPIKAFENELTPYKYSKGAIQFPIDKPIPFDLVTRIVAFRVQADSDRAKAKQ